MDDSFMARITRNHGQVLIGLAHFLCIYFLSFTTLKELLSDHVQRYVVLDYF